MLVDEAIEAELPEEVIAEAPVPVGAIEPALPAEEAIEIVLPDEATAELPITAETTGAGAEPEPAEDDEENKPFIVKFPHVIMVLFA